MKHCAAYLLLACALCWSGCQKARSSAAAAPDFAGVWDVTFDDSLEVELRIGETVVRTRTGEAGGPLELGDAGIGVVLDCARSELVCPSEVLARELRLSSPPGKLDEDATMLARSLTGVGRGRCAALPGSFLTAEVLSSAQPASARAEAVALTSGRARVVVDASCVAPAASLPAGAQLSLSAGFTAAKR